MKTTNEAPLMQLEQVTKNFSERHGSAAWSGPEHRAGKGAWSARGERRRQVHPDQDPLGSISATGGQIFWKNKPVHWTSPKEVKAMGVATIHQHIPVVPTLSVLENVFLDAERGWRAFRFVAPETGRVVRSGWLLARC